MGLNAPLIGDRCFGLVTAFLVFMVCRLTFQMKYGNHMLLLLNGASLAGRKRNKTGITDIEE